VNLFNIVKYTETTIISYLNETDRMMSSNRFHRLSWWVQRNSCKACGDTSGSCGPCSTSTTVNSQYCNYHGTQIVTVYYHDYGSCHDCGRVIDSGYCSCNDGYIGTYCNQACAPGQYAPQGSSVCSSCPTNTYSGWYAAGICTSCPPYQMSDGGASQCYGMPSSQPSSQPSCQPSTHPSHQPSSEPSSQPTSAPSTVQLETLPFLGYVYLISACSFCIIIAWSVFCCTDKYKSMDTMNILKQSAHYVSYIASQVTDYLFIIQLYYSLKQLHEQRSHGDVQAKMEYEDTLIFYYLSIIFKTLLIFVNLFCLYVFGELQYVVNYESLSLPVAYKWYDSIFIQPWFNCVIWWFPESAEKYDKSHINNFKYNFLALPLFPLCIIQSICYVIFTIIFVPMYLCIVIYFFLSNLVLFVTALSNSELNYTLYGIPKNKFPMTAIGLLADDVLQLVAQASYAIIEYKKYHHSLKAIQIASFVLTAWKLTVVLYAKYIDNEDVDAVEFTSLGGNIGAAAFP